MAAPPRERPVLVWPEVPQPTVSMTSSIPPMVPRRLRAALLGVAAAAAVLALRLDGPADVPLGLGLAVVLALLVPTSRSFARRVLLAGTLGFGWIPVTWWVPLPVGSVGRATLGLCLLAGGLAAWVGADPRRRVRALLPRFRRVDLLFPVVAAVGAVVLAPFLLPKTAQQAMGLLLAGWDHSAHFSMVHMARGYGVTVDALTALPPTGGTWQFASYPQGFHAVVATVIELMWGPVRGDLAAELNAYTVAVALVVLAAVLIVVAGVCALPGLGRRPAIVVPACAFVAAMYLIGPGADAVNGGFANFVVAATLVVAGVLVALPMARLVAPLPLAALGGAVVGVATDWAMLLVLAVPAALVVLVPLRASRWVCRGLRARWSAVGCGLIVALTIGCLVRIGFVLSRVHVPDNPLEIAGGIVAPDLGMVLAAAAACVGLCLLAGRHRVRWTALVATPVIGGVIAAVLVALQIDAAGKITYYGFKYLTGLELVTFPLLAAAAAVVLADVRWRTGRVRTTIAAAAVTVAVTQVFGLTAAERAPLGRPGGDAPPPPRAATPAAPGAENRIRQFDLVERPPTAAWLAERAPAIAQLAGPAPVVYLDVTAFDLPPAPPPGSPAGQPVAPPPAEPTPPAGELLGADAPAGALPPAARIDPVMAAQWYFALTDTWTTQANTLAVLLSLGDRSPAAIADSVRTVLQARPDVLVAVPPAALERLRAELGPALADRVIPA